MAQKRETEKQTYTHTVEEWILNFIMYAMNSLFTATQRTHAAHTKHGGKHWFRIPENVSCLASISTKIVINIVRSIIALRFSTQILNKFFYHQTRHGKKNGRNGGEEREREMRVQESKEVIKMWAPCKNTRRPAHRGRDVYTFVNQLIRLKFTTANTLSRTYFPKM